MGWNAASRIAVVDKQRMTGHRTVEGLPIDSGDRGGRGDIELKRLIGGDQIPVKVSQIALFPGAEDSDQLCLILRRIDQGDRQTGIVVSYDAHTGAKTDIA